MPKYQVIYADPPWQYGDFCQFHSKAGRIVKPLPYKSMSLEEIKALPVQGLSDKNCRLFLWATNRYLPEAFSVMKSWGFNYKQTLVWHKTGNPSPWGGSLAPNHAEFLLVGMRGRPRRVGLGKSNILSSGVAQHSQKPRIFREFITQVCGEVPRLELFARDKTAGWDVWGDEVVSDITMTASGGTPSGY